MKTLKIEITEITDETRWVWRLLSADGKFLGDHRVELDPRAGEFEGFVDLPRFIGWNSDNSGDPNAERALVGRVARWVASEVWGPMGESILTVAESEPVTVLIEVPEEAEFLLYRPFELAFVFEGKTPGADVSLIYDVCTGTSKTGGKHQVGSSLRMLALFSAPVDQVALNTRFERDQLRRLVEQASAMGRAIDLRILQYGVTRAQLENILEDGEGWDVVHFSGHGLAHGLVLETEEGNTDFIPSTEFAELLKPARARIKLITLNSCESGASAAGQALEALGIPTEENRPAEDDDGGGELPAAARNLTRNLRCAVVAMRYPVADEFAVRLAASLYEGALIHRQTLARALQRAIQKEATNEAGVSIATPALFGAMSRDLLLVPPQGEPPSFALSASKVAYFDPEPEHFVGRVRQLSRANSALAPKSEKPAIVFCGMAGAGKTACALELAYAHKDQRFEAMAWYRAPNNDSDIGEALAQFVKSLELQLNGFVFSHAIEDVETMKEFLPRFERLLTERSILIVVDNAESLLTENGHWRDERWETMVKPLISHNGRSRFVLTSRVVPAGLDRENVLVETIDTLSANEAALLALQMPNLSRLMSPSGPIGQRKGRALVRRALEIVQGHPKLIEMAEAAATDVSLLEERLAEAGESWSQKADLNAFFRTGGADDALEGEDFLTVLENWTLGLTRTIPEGPRFLFQLLCCVEREDRLLGLLRFALPLLWRQTERDDPPPDLETAVGVLASHGLIDVEQRHEDAFLRIHPAVESAERGEISSEFTEKVDTALSELWMGVLEASQKKEDLRVSVRAALSAAPYLLRLGEFSTMTWVLSLVIGQDPSPQKLAASLPLLRRALETTDEPGIERRLRREILKCHFGLGVREPESIAELKELVELAKAADNIPEVEVMRGTLFNELFRRNRFKEALELLDPTNDAELFAKLSESQKVVDAVHRFQLQEALGHHRKVLEEVDSLLEQVTSHEPTGDEGLLFSPVNLQEVILSVARVAAKNLEEWDKVLELNNAVRKIEVALNAPEIMRAKTDFNDHSALIELDRLPEAEDCLRGVRRIAEKAEDPQLLGSVFEAWAIVEKRRGRYEEAIAFARKALRSAYRFGLPSAINVGHHNLADFLTHFGADPQDIAAHRVAEVLISLQTGSGEYTEDVHTLALTIRANGGEPLPASFAELCSRLEEKWEIGYERFFNQLPRTLPGGEEALAFALSDALGLIELGLDFPPPDDEEA